MDNIERSEEEYLQLKQQQLKKAKQKINKELAGLSEQELAAKLAESSKNAVIFAKENKIETIIIGGDE